MLGFSVAMNSLNSWLGHLFLYRQTFILNYWFHISKRVIRSIIWGLYVRWHSAWSTFSLLWCNSVFCFKIKRDVEIYFGIDQRTKKYKQIQIESQHQKFDELRSAWTVVVCMPKNRETNNKHIRKLQTTKISCMIHLNTFVCNNIYTF